MAPKRKAAQISDSTSLNRSGNVDEDKKQFFQSTLSLILNLQDENGGLMADPFVKLPSKKLYPDYYQIISNPISIGDIQKRVKASGYDTVDKFRDDFQLLVDNATKYNDPESWIVVAAQKIFDFVNDQVNQFKTETPHPQKLKLKIKQPPPPLEVTEDDITFARLPELCTRILKDGINHEFPGDGKISLPFMDEVNTKEYPEYLNVVKTPTSFNNVLTQIRTKRLFNPKLSIINNLKKFHEAYNLIFTNAQLFNDPSSLIHQDALRLKIYIDSKYNELYERAEGKSTKLKLKLKQAKARALEASPTSLKKKLIKDEEIHDLVPGSHDPIAEPVLDQQAIENMELEDKPIILEKTTYNTLGKSLPLIPLDCCAIQQLSISSTLSQAQNITQQIHQRPFIHNNLAETKQALFPTHNLLNTINLFDYKFKANGYADQAFSLPLPPDSSPFINLKVGLHRLLYDLKKPEINEGQLIVNLTSDEDFQCKIYINDEESNVNGEIFVDKDSSLLGISYELKLSYGLNIIEFECKVAPNLSKKIKPGQIIDDTEVGGRHTRHQLQQLKLSWDVEKYTFYIVLNNA